MTGCDNTGEPRQHLVLLTPGEEPMIPPRTAQSGCSGAEPQDATFQPAPPPEAAAENKYTLYVRMDEKNARTEVMTGLSPALGVTPAV